MNKEKIINPVINSGLIPEKPHAEDWVFGGVTGGTSPVIFKDSHGWLKYQAPAETQKNKHFDSYSCVTFASLKSLAYYFKVVYNLEFDFSERFTAVMSGTIPGRGNTVRAVLESIRKHGFVTEADYPSLTPNMTQAEFFAPVPESVKKKALANLKKWKIEWETLSTTDIVPHGQIIEALKYSPVIVTGFAWASYYGDAGVYYDYDNPANHCFLGADHEANPVYDVIAEDSYPKNFEPTDQDNSEYIKKLAKVFKIHSAHKITVQPILKTNSLLYKLKNMFTKIKRDVHGAIWFVKDTGNGLGKQKIDNYLALSGAIVDEVGCQTLSDEELNKISDYKFFGK